MIGLPADLPISLDFDIALMILCNGKEKENLEEHKQARQAKTGGTRTVNLSDIFASFLASGKKTAGM